MSLNVVFMGSSVFSVIVLKELHTQFPVCGVVTQPDKLAGRGKTLTPPPVKITAQLMGIPVYQPLKLRTPESFEVLSSWKPDLIVVAAYGQILRQNVLDLPRFGCINVHASYLPRWRGASPIQAAIMNGDQSTGVTIMKMDAGVDTGAELAKQSLSIAAEDNAITLSEKLAAAGSVLLVTTLRGYLNGQVPLTPQEETGATYARMITKEDGHLDVKQSAVELERKVRAFIDWPGMTFVWDDQQLKIRKARVISNVIGEPGKRIISDGFPAIVTSSGALVLLEVQPPGKKWMGGADFLQGNKSWL